MLRRRSAKTQTGTKLGFTLTRETGGSSRLEVYPGFLTEFRGTPTAFTFTLGAVIDNESRELLAMHHPGFIVVEAGQIYRGYTNSDHGIDGEIEFKDAQGRASGKRLYVQLKSGDSYLKKRRCDGAEVFQIKNPRWADYWQQQAYAVMLVIRTSDGEIRWMDVSAYLKRESADGKAVKQIVFEGERFDAVSVRRWRERVLAVTSVS